MSEPVRNVRDGKVRYPTETNTLKEEGEEEEEPQAKAGDWRGRLYLFLVLVLHAEFLFDAVASLQEGLPLGSFCQDAHKQPWQVDTGEQHRVGSQLQTYETEKTRVKHSLSTAPGDCRADIRQGDADNVLAVGGFVVMWHFRWIKADYNRTTYIVNV